VWGLLPARFAGIGLDTTIKYLRRTTSVTAGNNWVKALYKGWAKNLLNPPVV
jgi:hypothetical protein